MLCLKRQKDILNFVLIMASQFYKKASIEGIKEFDISF